MRRVLSLSQGYLRLLLYFAEILPSVPSSFSSSFSGLAGTLTANLASSPSVKDRNSSMCTGIGSILVTFLIWTGDTDEDADALLLLELPCFMTGIESTASS